MTHYTRELCEDKAIASLAFEIAELTCSPGFIPTEEDWELAELLSTFD